MSDEPWYVMGFSLAPILFIIPGFLALRERLVRLEEEVRSLTHEAGGREGTPRP